MKHKFLFGALVALFALLPGTMRAQCDGGTQCSITIEMSADYSWGWEGDILAIYQGEDLVEEIDWEDGSSYSTTVSVCSEEEVTVKVEINSEWGNEHHFTIYNCDGTEEISGTADTYEETSFAVKSPSCMEPTDFAASDITTSSMTLTWSDNVNVDATYTLTYTDADGIEQVIPNATSPYELTNLSEFTAYTFSLVANCSEEESSKAVTLTAFTSCSIETCEVEISTSGYGFNYYDAYVSLLMNGNEFFRKTSSSTQSIEVCPIAPIQFSMKLGVEEYYGSTYTYGGTVTIKNGVGLQVYSQSVESEGVFYTLNKPCPSCIPPTELTFSDYTTQGATLTWTAGANETQWLVVIDTNEAVMVDEASYTIQGLDPFTEHTAYVMSYCGDDTSSASSATFKTLCEKTSCFVRVAVSPDYSYYWNNTDESGITVKRGDEVIASFRDTEKSIEICPNGEALDFSIGVYATYWGAIYGASVKVYDGGDAEVYASDGSIKESGEFFTLETPCPSCLPPTAMALDSTLLDESTLSFHWVNRAESNDFAIYLNGEKYDNTTDTFYTFYGLTANTAYTLGVQVDCGDDDISSIVRMQARTACGEMSLPYVEDWETIEYNGAWPSCWTRIIKYNTDPSVNNVVNHTPNGTYSMYLATGGNENMFASDRVPLDGDKVYVSFWARFNNATLKAGVMTNLEDTSTFIPLLTIEGGNSNTWTEYEFNTSALDAESSYYVAWYISGGSSWGQAGAIDDITIDEYTGCDRPAMTMVDSLAPYEAYISWNQVPAADKYYVYYSKKNDLNDPDMNGPFESYDTTYTITDLDPQTTYFAWVRTSCNSNQSAYKAFPYFSTQRSCAPVQNVKVEEVNYVAAKVSWEYNTEVGFPTSGVYAELVNESTHDTLGFDLEGTKNLFRDLTPGTKYTAIFHNYCETTKQTDTATAVSVTFTTASVAEGEEAPTCFAPMPELVSTDSNQIVVTWNKIGDEQKFYVEYKAAGDADYTVYSSITDTALYLSGLDGNTMYTIVVASLCGDESPYDTLRSTISARTECATLKVPFFDGFEGGDNGQAPYCWTTSDAVTVVTNNTFQGTKAMRLNGTNERTAATDVIPLDGDAIAISFAAKLSDAELVVGLQSDLNDLTTFIAIDTIEESDYTEYDYYTSLIPGVSASERYHLVFRHTGTYSYDYYCNTYIDNVNIREDNGCHRPYDVVAEADTSDIYKMNIGWANTGTDGNFIVVYGIEGNETTNDTISTTNLNEVLTVQPSKTYEITVGVLCSNGDTIWAKPIVAASGCGYEELPYLEDFDEYAENAMPPCWVYDDSKVTHFDGGLFFKSYNGRAAAVLPRFYAPVSKMELTMKVKVGSTGDNDGVLIGVADDDGNLIEWIDSIQSDYFSRTAYQVLTYNFLEYEGEGTRIALGQKRSWGEWACYDSISLLYLPDCYPPINLTPENIDDVNNTKFTWSTQGEVNSFQVYYDTIGIDIDTVSESKFITVESSEYTIPAGYLEGGKKYSFYVRSLCSPVSSNWTRHDFYGATIVMNNSSVADTVYGCSMTIFDNGYTAGYKESSTSALVIYPSEVGKELQVKGGIFGWGADPITLTFYDGVGTNGEILYQITNTGTTEYSIDSAFATSTEGAMTITFSSGYNAHWGYEIYTQCVDGASCHRPGELVATSVSYDNATITWEGNADNYTVEYQAEGNDTWESKSTNTNSITLTDLTPTTTYSVRVTGVCSTDDQSKTSFPISFTTICAPIVITAEEPYLQDFEDADAPADCFTLVYADGDATTNTIVHTTADKVSGSRSIRFSGTSTTDDYNQYLITPMLSSEENILVSYYAKSSVGSVPLRLGYSTTGSDLEDFSWNATAQVAEGAWVKYTASIPSTATFIAFNVCATSAFNYLYIDSLYLSVTVEEVCLAPTITGTEATSESITVNFVADGNVEVDINSGSTFSSTNPQPATGTSYTFDGLAPEATYTIGVRTDCGNGKYSAWTTVTVTTQNIDCDVPEGLAVSNVSYTTATVSWEAGSASEWEVRIASEDYVDTVLTETATLQLTGLAEATSYNVMVRALCSETVASAWSAAVAFTTKACAEPTNASATNVTTTSAVINWTSDASQWELRVNGDVLSSPVSSKPYTLENLEPGTNYNVSIRALCADGIVSDWSAPATFTTEKVGIDDVDATEVITLYPNPATTSVTLDLSQVSGTATVSLTDLNGRDCGSYATSDATLTIDLTSLARGTYFVRVSGETFTTVRKLIVQ